LAGLVRTLCVGRKVNFGSRATRYVLRSRAASRWSRSLACRVIMSSGYGIGLAVATAASREMKIPVRILILEWVEWSCDVVVGVKLEKRRLDCW
jgi:hypothetical protein